MRYNSHRIKLYLVVPIPVRADRTGPNSGADSKCGRERGIKDVTWIRDTGGMC